MARCKPVDDLTLLIINGAEMQVTESSESESEDDNASSSYQVIDGGNDYNGAEMQVTESSESDLEIDNTRNSYQVIDGGNDNNSYSPEIDLNEIPTLNVGPVLSLKCLHDDNTDEVSDQHPEQYEMHSETLPVKIVAVNGFTSVAGPVASLPSASIPARNNWEGVHNFKIKIDCNDCPKKSESSMFSDSRQKLYVAKGHPIKVLIYAENVPKGSVIRVTAVFTSVERSYEIVTRCPTHSQQDYANGNPVYEHFVQCFSAAAIYEKNPESGKLSVSVPYEDPREGETYTTYLFKLTCFSSCTGGINRRPFMLVFTLEKDNIPLGRQTIEAKVCACPLRDYKVDQEREHGKKSKSDITARSSSEKETNNPKYTISVKDPDLYLFLKQMKCLYEMSAYVSKIKPDTH